MAVLGTLAFALILTTLAARLTHRIDQKTSDGLNAFALGLWAVQSIREGDTLWALFQSGFCAYLAREWWRGGGGDDTRRRWRRAAGRFEGRRRTAPTAA